MKPNQKKIAFISNFGLIEPFGILHLGATLKQHGYSYDIILIKKNWEQEIREYKPDIVAYNTIMGTQDFLLDVNRQVKKILPGVFSLFGGVYPTIVQDFIHEEGVDAICVGEGEGAIIELMEAMSYGGDLTSIRNLHVKENGKIKKNPVRPIISDLDSLPFPDRDVLYSKNKILKEIVARRFFSKRGCPFSCNYCYNPAIKSVYDGEKHFRSRSPENVIREVEQVMEKYPSPTVHFQDDTFTHNNREWIFEFAEKYKKRVDKPFTCLLRIKTFKPDMIKALSDAGLYHVLLGVETASEDLRSRVLGRKYSNEAVREGCRILRENNVKFRTLNMLGLPEGGLKEAMETLKFNIEIKPFSAAATLFQPYPGTSMAKFAKENGYVPDDFDFTEATSLWGSTKLSFGSPREGKQLVTLQRFFSLAVRVPWIAKMLPLILRLPDNQAFVLLCQLNRGYELWKTYRRGMTPYKLYNYVKYFFNAKELI